MTTVFGTLDHVLLMAPGPSPVAPNVLEAMSLPTLGHLDPDCIKVMDALQEQLRAVCKTRNAVTFPISGTGSAGMEACFVNLQRLSLDYYNVTSAGHMLSRVMSDTDRIASCLAWVFPDILWGFAYIFGVLGVMLSLSPSLAMTIIVIAPIVTALTVYFQKKLIVLNREVRAQHSKITSSYNEGIMGAKTSKTLALEGRLNALGLHYVDAPISGGAAKAASGQMTMMTSAKPEAYAAAGAVLDGMAGKVYRLGDKAGAGSKVKIINQLLAGVHIAVAAEAMALGLREGVEASALYEVITNSAGNSWMFENRMAHVLAGDYTPLSAVDIFVKDLGLVLDTARASKFPLPLAATAHQMFMQASTAGFAKEDDSAVIKIFPGITLPEGKEKKA